MGFLIRKSFLVSKRFLACCLLFLVFCGISLYTQYTHAGEYRPVAHVHSHFKITGCYNCIRTDPQGNQFPLKLTIKKAGKAYIFKWQTPEGPGFIGVGLLHENGKTIAANFWDVSNSESMPGVIVYQLQGNDTLTGNWMITNQPIIGSEVCTKEVRAKGTKESKMQNDFLPPMGQEKDPKEGIYI